MDWVVIDTEGYPTLSEVAVLDAQGQLIYEAFVADHPRNAGLHLNQKSLQEIVQELRVIVQNKRVVAHLAEHDAAVLRSSYVLAQVPWNPPIWHCTCELARQMLPTAQSYSLEYLSKQLNLKVNRKRFDAAQAHTARYDAEFTYQLYLRLLTLQQHHLHPHPMATQPQPLLNPFSSSRVDHPFQDHLDLRAVYQTEFEYLTSALTDIKADPNHQSKGAIVIGVAGSGKTHLMMRLAKEFLKTNRLLFIRQPNHAESVLHHTYSRILESFAERVGQDRYTQLELLIANSFIQVLSSLSEVTTTQKGQALLAALKNDPLSLYSRIGKTAQRRRDNWQYIERHIMAWWAERYTTAGYSASILKGIIKFCSYTDVQKRDRVRSWLAGSELESDEIAEIGLENWREDLSREAFALEAIAVFGRLSILDEPLIIVFDQLEGLGLAHNQPILKSFGEAVKELLTHVPNSLMILNVFPDRWQQFQAEFDRSVVDRISQYQIHLKMPPRDKLEDILRLKAEATGVNLSTLFTTSERSDIVSQPSIRAVLNRAADYFRYKVNHLPLPHPEPESQRRASLDDRVQHLERVLQQIAALIAPHLTGDPPVIPCLPVEPSVAQGGDPSTAPSVVQALPHASSLEIVQEYLKQQQILLNESYTKPTIISEADDIGKFITLIEALKLDQPLQIEQLRLGKNKLPDHVLIQTPRRKFMVAFLHVSGSSFTSRIKNFNQLVLNHPDIQFYLIRDVREPDIKGAVGKTEIEKLDYSVNGEFKWLEQADRVPFEVLYKLITDIQEQDLDVDLATAMTIALQHFKQSWFVAQLLPVADRGDG